jgi:23S rRNA pseudouridine1911/1915/1917 synthase
MNIPILHEDTSILVLNKPAGIVVHPFDFSSEKTILDFLKKISPKIFSVKNTLTLADRRKINLGGIVHKLDRDTTGIMVIAKNETAFNELKEQFSNDTVTKTYLALVEGKVEKDSFVVDAPLGRSKKNHKQRANPSNPRGEVRHAVTEVKVIARNRQEGQDSTFVELTPRTARAQQLRAHMSHIGHPIVGDTKYGSTFISDRIMIHAKSLTFNLYGASVTFATNDDFITNIK